MTLPHNAIANLKLARQRLDQIIATPADAQGDELVLKIAARLCAIYIYSPEPTENEMALAVMLALAIERLRVQEGFAA